MGRITADVILTVSNKGVNNEKSTKDQGQVLLGEDSNLEDPGIINNTI